MNNELIAIIAIIQGMIGRNYGLSDDTDPAIVIGGVSARNAAAAYSPTRNELAFRRSMIWQGTIAHELAHWLQWHIEGDTDCLASSQGDDAGLQNRHKAYEDEIRSIMRKTGWDNELQRVLG